MHFFLIKLARFVVVIVIALSVFHKKMKHYIVTLFLWLASIGKKNKLIRNRKFNLTRIVV